MEIKHQSIDIDINSTIPAQVQCVAHTNDNNTRFVDVSLYNSGQRIIFSAESKFKAIFVTNGILINDNVPCKATNNIIEVPIDKNALKRIIGGKMAVEIVITDGTQVISPSVAFYVRVTDSILNNVKLIPQSEGTIADVLKEIAEARGEFEKLADKINSKIDDKDGSVKTNHLAKSSITGEKIADNAIQTQHIDRGVITAAKLYGIDTSPELNSHNLVYSDGVYRAIENATNGFSAEAKGIVSTDNKAQAVNGCNIAQYLNGISFAIGGGEILGYSISTTINDNSFTVSSDESNNVQFLIIGSNVTSIENGVSSKYPNLLGTYIINSSGNITVNDSGLKASYHPDKTFNDRYEIIALSALHKQIINVNELLSKKEDVSNKKTTIYASIENPTENYPTISFLLSGFYTKADFESGTGTLNSSHYMIYDAFTKKEYSYIKIVGYVIVVLDIEFSKDISSGFSGAPLSGIPFPTKCNIYKQLKATDGNDVYIHMNNDGGSQMYMYLTAPNGLTANSKIRDTIIYQIRE